MSDTTHTPTHEPAHELPPEPAAPELPPPPDPLDEAEAMVKAFESKLADPRLARVIAGLQHMRNVLGPGSHGVCEVELCLEKLFGG
jgi:hypothetical protein